MKLFPNKAQVSVIIASYNHRDFVKEAVMSVLNQGVNDMEVIIVDDGSSDGTPDEVKKIKNPRIKLICLGENRKQHPRNLGLSLARGKYVAFQNSDDKWAKGKLKKQLDYLDNNPKTVSCFTSVGIIDESGKPKNNFLAKLLFLSKNKKSNAWLRYFFDIGNCLFISSALIQRDKIEEVGRFTPNLFRAADLDLWVRLASRGEFHIINEDLTMMRIIKNKNFSRPSAEATNLSQMELAEIFENYTREPILSRLPEIFGDVIPGKNNSEIESIGRLALYSWGLTAAHILFANKIIGETINNDSKRKELTDIFGAEIIQKYIKKRSAIELNLKKSKSIPNLAQKFFRRLWQ